MPKNITSIDVAEYAQVSQSTVSRVFSDNSPNVAEATRQRVLDAARELGYRPNVIARMMSSRETNIVGIVMGNITSPFYPYVLDKFLQKFQELDKQVLLFTVAEGQSIDDVLPLVLQYQVDALIITSATLSSDMADEYTRNGTPVILFNRTVSNSPISFVCADNVAGGRMIADLFLDNGHERLAYIAGPSNTSTNNDRERGFAERLMSRGYQRWRRAQADYTYESGYEAALNFLENGQPPDAIFCANDIMALGAMDAMRSHNLCIPDDVSIVGFDDIPMASWGAYNLTTVSQEVDLMIDKTLDILKRKLEEPDSPPIGEVVAGQLIRRGSVKQAT